MLFTVRKSTLMLIGHHYFGLEKFLVIWVYIGNIRPGAYARVLNIAFYQNPWIRHDSEGLLWSVWDGFRHVLLDKMFHSGRLFWWITLLLWQYTYVQNPSSLIPRATILLQILTHPLNLIFSIHPLSSFSFYLSIQEIIFSDN